MYNLLETLSPASWQFIDYHYGRFDVPTISKDEADLLDDENSSPGFLIWSSESEILLNS